MLSSASARERFRDPRPRSFVRSSDVTRLRVASTVRSGSLRSGGVSAAVACAAEQRTALAAVDDHDGSVDVAAAVVDQEQDDIGDLIRFAHAASDIHLAESLDVLAQHLLGAIGVYGAR